METINPQKLIENFSTHLKNTIARSISIATHLNAEHVSPIHLILALAEEEGSVGGEILRKNGMKKESAQEYILKVTKISRNKTPIRTRELPELDLSSRHIIEKALTHAYNHEHNHIGTEHLLFAIISVENSMLDDLLRKQKINKQQIQEQLELAFGNAAKYSHIDDMNNVFNSLEQSFSSDDADPERVVPPIPSPASLKQHGSQKNILALFTTHLTDKKIQATIDPVIGRDKEIERMIHILARRTKNNPILVGEPGVGKTAIVEGLAKKIAEKTVPDILKNKKIFALDLALLVAGTVYRGEFEARLKHVIDECSNHPDWILFIDELHNIIGAGSNAGTMDAANILKPALARGQLHCIGATTFEEYKKYITGDPALERRFQPIYINEPTQKETRAIVEGVKQYYEQFHKVHITPKALDASVLHSERYIHDNFQPDKALDLLDEACGLVRTSIRDSATTQKQQILQQELEQCQEQKQKAIASERLSEAIQWKQKEQALKHKLSILGKQTGKEQAYKTFVTEKDVARVLANRLGINPETIMIQDWENLQQLENKLQSHIIGQDRVIHEVVSSLRKSYIRGVQSDKPLSSLLFVGPSGVGKTKLATLLADALYRDPDALVRLDMTEFSESHSVSKILGSPAGYVGYKDRNPFIEQLKRKPYSVVLFDEIDKAHKDVTKLLLHMLDEGSITDSSNKKIHLKQSTIILTTNVGSELLTSSGIGFGEAKKQQDVHKLIIKRLKEEFGTTVINRLDHICIFNALSPDDIQHIIKQHVDRIIKQLKETQRIQLKANETVLQELTHDMYDKDAGARHIEKQIQDLIHERLVDVLEKQKKKKTYTLTRRHDSYQLI